MLLSLIFILVFFVSSCDAQLLNAGKNCDFELLRKCVSHHQFNVNALSLAKERNSTYQCTALIASCDKEFIRYLLKIKADPLVADSRGAVKAHFDVTLADDRACFFLLNLIFAAGACLRTSRYHYG